MSRVSISRSYAVFVGLESYTHTRKRIKTAEAVVVHEKDKLIHPDRVKMEEEAQRDKSQSAEKERQYLAQQREVPAKRKAKAKAKRSLTGKLTSALGRLRVGQESPVDDGEGALKRVPGTGPEDGIPAPEGQR